MFRVCNACGEFNIDDYHGCNGKPKSETNLEKVKESLAKSPLTEKAREYKEKYFPDDQAQKPECPFCGDKRGIEHPSPCVCHKPDAPAREWIIDDAYDLVAGPHPGKERIHVIEKSHAEALAKRVTQTELERTIWKERVDSCQNWIDELREELAAAKAEIEFLTRGLSGAEHLWQERLTQANQQIKFLEENMERKEHYWSGIKEKLKEREQRLVAIIEKMHIIAAPNEKGHSPRDTASQILGVYFDEFCALKAHKGGA